MQIDAVNTAQTLANMQVIGRHTDNYRYNVKFGKAKPTRSVRDGCRLNATKNVSPPPSRRPRASCASWAEKARRPSTASYASSFADPEGSATGSAPLDGVPVRS